MKSLEIKVPMIAGEVMTDSEKAQWPCMEADAFGTDDLYGLSQCGCTFILQAVGFDMVWIPCPDHDMS